MINPLSANEFKILQVLWEEGRSLSRPEIIERTPDKDWNPNSIHLILNNMIDKGVLCVDGLTRCGKGYGRTYAPTMTQMEYAAQQAMDATPNYSLDERLLGVVAALVGNGSVSDKTISELENLLRAKRAELGK